MTAQRSATLCPRDATGAPIPSLLGHDPREYWLRCIKAVVNASTVTYVCVVKSPAGQLCGFMKGPSELKYHVETVHAPHISRCANCNWQFRDPPHLARHRNIHTLTTPCTHCGQAFVDPDVRLNHLIDRHNFLPNA